MSHKNMIEDVLACAIWFGTFLVLFWIAAAADAGVL